MRVSFDSTANMCCTFAACGSRISLVPLEWDCCSACWCVPLDSGCQHVLVLKMLLPLLCCRCFAIVMDVFVVPLLAVVCSMCFSLRTTTS